MHATKITTVADNEVDRNYNNDILKCLFCNILIGCAHINDMSVDRKGVGLTHRKRLDYDWSQLRPIRWCNINLK